MLVRVLALLATLLGMGWAEPWEPRRFPCRDGEELPYQWHRPADLHRPVPLILFLHGAGERGSDNQAPLSQGVSRLLGNAQALVVVPQCPQGQRWVEVDWGLQAHQAPAQPSKPLGHVMELLEELRHLYPVDPDRVYLMGLSMGAFGCWDLAARQPDRFVAGVFICGGADEATAPRLSGLQAWLFHGAQDDVVSVERSRRMLQALREAGGQPRYTEYPEVGHDAWHRAFAEPELMPWLMNQRRSTTSRLP